MTTAVRRVDGRTAGVLRQLGRVHGAHRYMVLFYTLLFTLAAAPLLTALRFDADLLQILLAFNLFVALLDIPEQRWRGLLMLIAAVCVAVRVAPVSAVGVGVTPGALAVASAVALLTAASAARFAMRAEVISAEQLYAALSVYLLAGLFFGLLYWALELTWPGSFGETSPSTTFRLSTAIYFSFVTLATLGFGDVVPKTEAARGVAVLEAVGGQLYVAVTIARLVGAQFQRRG